MVSVSYTPEPGVARNAVQDAYDACPSPPLTGGGDAESSDVFDTPVYRRVFDQILRGLHRQAPRHVALVHEPGVGEELVLRELAGRCRQSGLAFLRDRHFVLVDGRSLQPADWRALLETRQADDTVLCFDGFGEFLATKSPPDRAVILAALSASRSLRCVGTLSARDYKELSAADRHVRDEFLKIELDEPDVSNANAMVRNYGSKLKAHYGVSFDDDVVTRAVTLTQTYLPHERLPSKAFRVLRAVCDDVAYDRASGAVKERITADDVLAKVSQSTGIPASTLAGTGRNVDYAAVLRGAVVGQDHAVREVATELGLLDAGFASPGKPASVMMFIGQTGTGKTELAKAIARSYSPAGRLKTFTLGNFSEAHSVSGIVGVPAGYVGHEQGGKLINDLNDDAFGVFLLDEADKAHPDVMQPFLNLFDEGWVCDQRGTKAYADQAIFILTTNIGHRQIADLCAAGKTDADITFAIQELLSKIRHTKSNRPVFTPEFMARIKRVVVFRSLGADAMDEIARLRVAELQKAWAGRRQKRLVVPPELTAAIGRCAYAVDRKSQGKEGGRVVRKIIADVIESPVQRAISVDPEAYRNHTSVVLAYAASADHDTPQALHAAVAVSLSSEGAQS